MRTFRVLLVPLLLAAALGGACAPVPFVREERVPVTALGAGELADRHWPASGERYRFRQTVRLDYGGRRVLLEGFLALDTAAGTARFLAMDVMGVTLMDISFGKEGMKEHFAVPGLTGALSVPELFGRALERAFLGPLPRAGDSLAREKYRHRLIRSEGGKTLYFLFGGAGPVLLEKGLRNGEWEEWRVRYYEHESLGHYLLPTGIVYDDLLRGYRLTIWNERSSIADEQP